MKISSEMRSPDPANEEAATQLGDFLIQYRGIQKKPNRQETQLIKGLLLDAQQGKYTAPLQTLQLTTVLTKLKKLLLMAVPSLIKKKAMKSTEKSPIPILLMTPIKPLRTEETSSILSNSGILPA